MSEEMFATSQADNRLGLSDVTPWARKQGGVAAAVRDEAEQVVDNVDHRLNERLQQRQTSQPEPEPAPQPAPRPSVATPKVVLPTPSSTVPQNEIHPVQGSTPQPTPEAVQPRPAPAPQPDPVAPRPTRPSFQLPPESAATAGAGGVSLPEKTDPVAPNPVPQPEYRPAPSQPAQPAAYTFRQPARPAMETMQVPAMTTAPQPPQMHPHGQVPAMHTTYLQAADDDLFNLLETLDNRVTSMEQAISDLRRSQPAADGTMLRPVEKAVQRLSERLDRLDGGNQQQIGYDDEVLRSRPQKRRKGNGLMGGLLDVFRR